MGVIPDQGCPQLEGDAALKHTPVIMELFSPLLTLVFQKPLKVSNEQCLVDQISSIFPQMIA